MKLYLTSTFNKASGGLAESISHPKGKRVAFIPTAADIYEDKYFVEKDEEKLVEMGFEVSNFDLKVDPVDSLSDFDMIFVAGGNSFYLMEKFVESGLNQKLPKLLEKDIVYIGSSAGSVVLCPDIDYVKDFDDPTQAKNLENHQGVGLVDFLIVPHYDNPKFRTKMDKFFSQMKHTDWPFLALSEAQALIVKDNFISIYNEESKIFTKSS